MSLGYDVHPPTVPPLTESTNGAFPSPRNLPPKTLCVNRESLKRRRHAQGRLTREDGSLLEEKLRPNERYRKISVTTWADGGVSSCRAGTPGDARNAWDVAALTLPVSSQVLVENLLRSNLILALN